MDFAVSLVVGLVAIPIIKLVSGLSWGEVFLIAGVSEIILWFVVLLGEKVSGEEKK